MASRSTLLVWRARAGPESKSVRFPERVMASALRIASRTSPSRSTCPSIYASASVSRFGRASAAAPESFSRKVTRGDSESATSRPSQSTTRTGARTFFLRFDSACSTGDCQNTKPPRKAGDISDRVRRARRLERPGQQPLYLLLELLALLAVLQLDPDALRAVARRMDRIDPCDVPLHGDLGRIFEQSQQNE